MMPYTYQMSSSGGGSPPDLDKLFIPTNIIEDYLSPLNEEMELLNKKFLKQQMKSTIKILESFSFNKIEIEEIKVSQEVIEDRLEKWVAKDKIEVEAIKKNSIKAYQFFIMANLNCKENEISVPCLPIDLLKDILIIKTISENQDASDREATFVTRKNKQELFCGNPLYESFEKVGYKSDFQNSFFEQPAIELKTNDSWCQIQ